MDSFILQQVLLVMHLSGLVLMAGTTVSEFVAFRWFVSLLKSQDKASVGLFRLLSRLGPILLAGGVLLVISGVGLMILTEGVYLQQFWLQVKLILILLLPLNGLLVGNPQMKWLRNNLFAEGSGLSLPIQPTLTKLTWFHTVQLLVFLAIIILAVFKFT
ncbi:DUF2269 family protein [Spirosoma sp. KCTC 42546]|uniref:DUF2269 family protein n=1 Tax=Spirosoma sp. KCTC 42546 TaxID=2520506 RepID=UPI00115BF0C7|nr:DUF2269 family protein [Spirosoma sp. KCTC 42546]QDK81868.1 DUF2269 family protein [Spirosoma sp. KCTC 42546]